MKGRTTNRKPPTFGHRLASARRARGLTQEAFAAMLGFTRTTLRHYELHVADPKLSVAIRCCKALKVSLEELVGDAGQSRRSANLERFMRPLLSMDPPKQKLALRLSTALVLEIRKKGGILS